MDALYDPVTLEPSEDSTGKYFTIHSHAYYGGRTQINLAKSAEIMGVSNRTAASYHADINKADNVRLRYLQAVIGKRLIPEPVPIWFNRNDTRLCTEHGISFAPDELVNYSYARQLDSGIARDLKRELQAARQRIELLESQLRTLKGEQTVTLPENVVAFPGKITTNHKERDL